MQKSEYPRVYVSASTHLRVKKLAKRLNVPMIKISDKIVKAGLKAFNN